MPKAASYVQWSLQSYSIGLKLRALRTQKRMTLARLSAETGLSTALLSKLETDRMVPTLPTLATISRAYGVGMSHFFAEPTKHLLSITRKAHFDAHERGMEQVKVVPLNAVEDCPAPSIAPSEHADFESDHEGSPLSRTRGLKRHSHGPHSPRLVAQMIDFPVSGAVSTSETFRQHSGLMYVLEGNLQLESGGLHEILHQGDCAYIESDMALSWSAAGKRRCRVLAVFPGAAESA